MQGRLKWDPATLRRAVRDIKADRAKQKRKAKATISGSSSTGAKRKPGRRSSPSASGLADSSASVSEEGSNTADEGSDDDDDGCRVSVLDCEDFSRADITEHEFFLGWVLVMFVACVCLLDNQPAADVQKVSAAGHTTSSMAWRAAAHNLGQTSMKSELHLS